MLFKSVIFLCLLVYSHADFEGDFCKKDDLTGICTLIINCRSAIADLRQGKFPQTCGFMGSEPIVCCLDNAMGSVHIPTTHLHPVITTTKRPLQTTTMYIPPEADYVYENGNKVGSGGGSCKPIPADMTTSKTGSKAFDKCIEYQEKYVYPCERGVALTGEYSRSNNCHHNADQLIVGGNDTTKNEFPHMVMLGYGQDTSFIQWLCGGSIISERYILTAGHCISTRDEGEVKFVLVGAYTRSDARKTSNIYRVRRIIRHPEYKPPSKYNDIALLETETPIKLNSETIPACLHVGDSVAEDRVLATGWGLTTYGGSTSEVMQKVILHKFSNQECSNSFVPQRLMRNGYDPNTQTCYGDKTESKDTCQGDSGGPIQIKSKKIHCMYVIVGVTSFGKGCGFIGEPAIYTRVDHYVPWIESNVWP